MCCVRTFLFSHRFGILWRDAGLGQDWMATVEFRESMEGHGVVSHSLSHDGLTSLGEFSMPYLLDF